MISIKSKHLSSSELIAIYTRKLQVQAECITNYFKINTKSYQFSNMVRNTTLTTAHKLLGAKYFDLNTSRLKLSKTNHDRYEKLANKNLVKIQMNSVDKRSGTPAYISLDFMPFTSMGTEICIG